MELFLVPLGLSKLYRRSSIRTHSCLDVDGDGIEEVLFSIKYEGLADLGILNFSPMAKDVSIDVRGTKYNCVDMCGEGWILIAKARDVIFAPSNIVARNYVSRGLEIPEEIEIKFSAQSIEDFRELIVCVKYSEIGLLISTTLGLYLFKDNIIKKIIEGKLDRLSLKEAKRYYGLTKRTIEKAKSKGLKIAPRLRTVIKLLKLNKKKYIVTLDTRTSNLEVFTEKLEPIVRTRLEQPLALDVGCMEGEKDQVIALLEKEEKLRIRIMSLEGKELITKLKYEVEPQLNFDKAFIAIGDINGDEVSEIVVATSGGELWVLDKYGRTLIYRILKKGVNGIVLADVDGDGLKEFVIGIDDLYLGKLVTEQTISLVLDALKHRDFVLTLLARFMPQYALPIKSILGYDSKLFDEIMSLAEQDMYEAISRLAENMHIKLTPTAIHILNSPIGKLLIMAYSTPYIPTLIKEVPTEILPLDLIPPRVIPPELLAKILKEIDILNYPKFYLSLKISEPKLKDFVSKLKSRYGTKAVELLKKIIDAETILNIAKATKFLSKDEAQQIIDEIRRYVQERGAKKDTLIELYKMGIVDLPEETLEEILSSDPEIFIVTAQKHPDLIIKKIGELPPQLVRLAIRIINNEEYLKQIIEKLGPKDTVLYLQDIPPDIIPQEYWNYYLNNFPEIIGENSPPTIRFLAAIKTKNYSLLESAISQNKDLLERYYHALPPEFKIILHIKGIKKLDPKSLEETVTIVENPEIIINNVNTQLIPPNIKKMLDKQLASKKSS